MQLKSYLLTALIDNAEAEKVDAFSRDISLLLSIDERDRTICLEAIPEIRRMRTRTELKHVLENVTAKIDGIPQPQVELAIRAANFFIDGLLSERIPEADDELWGDDLIVELEWLDESLRCRFETFLKDLRKLMPVIEEEERKERTRDGVLPVFNSLGITVELRAVRKDRYRWGTPVQEYDPVVAGTVNVASIHIGLDVGQPRDIYFQADETGINNIISTFEAAKKEIAALKTYLGLSEQQEQK